MKAPTRTSDRMVKLMADHVNITDAEVDAMSTRETRDLIRSIAGEGLRNRALDTPAAPARSKRPPNPPIQAKAPARGRKR